MTTQHWTLCPTCGRPMPDDPRVSELLRAGWKNNPDARLGEFSHWFYKPDPQFSVNIDAAYNEMQRERQRG